MAEPDLEIRSSPGRFSFSKHLLLPRFGLEGSICYNWVRWVPLKAARSLLHCFIMSFYFLISAFLLRMALIALFPCLAGCIPQASFVQWPPER